MAIVAIDDTDTRESGCTTALAWHLVGRLRREVPALQVGRAALVRLNPAAPHRTRGNGALAFRVDVSSHADADDARATPRKDLIQRVSTIVQEVLPGAGADGTDPQPAALWLPTAPAPRLYEAAVAQMVTPEWACRAAPEGSVRLHGPEARRGEIGALAAASWLGCRDRLPEERVTYECLVYRAADHDAPARGFQGPDLEASLSTLVGGFDHFVEDGTEHGSSAPAAGVVPPRRYRVVPRTPCPVIAGVRGHDPAALERWLEEEAPALFPEMVGGWVVASNQASADHARFAWRPSRDAGGADAGGVGDNHDAWPAATVVVARVMVMDPPQARRGGHVRVRAEGADGRRLWLWAFEPTKRFRHVVAALRPGDGATVLGRVSREPEEAAMSDAISNAISDASSGTTVDVALEGVLVERLTSQGSGRPNPTCPGCGRAMSSQGRGAGFRCVDCGARSSPDDALLGEAPRPDGGTVRVGAWYQVDDAARGHLLPPRGSEALVRAALGCD